MDLPPRAMREVGIGVIAPGTIFFAGGADDTPTPTLPRKREREERPTMRLPRRLLALALPLVARAPAAAQAPAWPTRPVEMTIGFPNSSGVGIYARRIADPLSRVLCQPVVVNPRIGA